MKRMKIASVIIATALLIAITLAMTLGVSADTNWGFFTRDEKPRSEYAYSIAVIGDTQSLVNSDVNNMDESGNYASGYEPRTEKIYDWLVANKDSKNIKMVLGLGDIVETWNKSTDAYKARQDKEWGLALEQIQKLDAADMDYTLVRGNHDDDEYFNNWIGDNMKKTYVADVKANGAFMYETEYENSYRRLTVGKTTWLILTLDWGVTEAELDWAAGIIEANPNDRVIVTMHNYLYHDGTIDGKNDSAATATPNPNWDYTTDPTAENGDDLVYNPDGIWERLISKHSNIELVLSGHVTNSSLQRSQVIGDHGNTVTQILVDPQSMDLDRNNAGGCGMVCMLYFNEDGSLADTSEWDERTVDVEWYSTIKNQYYKDSNQFTIDLDLYDGGEECAYGVIPKAYTDKSLYPFVNFGYDTDIDEYFFLGGYDHWMDEDGGGAYPSLSVISSKKVPSFILLRDDYVMSEKDSVYSMGKLTLDLSIDLNGKSITTYHYVKTVTNQDGSTKDENVALPLIHANLGTPSHNTVRIYGDEGSSLFVGSKWTSLINLGTSSNGAGATFDITVTGVTIGFAEGAESNKLIADTFNMGSANNTPVTTTQSITLNDCTIDLTAKPAGKTAAVFKLDETVSDAKNVQIANVTVNGGNIIDTDFSAVSLCSKNSNDSFVFGKGSDGNYTSLTLSSGATPPATVYSSTDSETALEFSLSGTEGDGTVTYPLVEAAGIMTEYGYLPDSVTSPFVVFKEDGSYTAYTTWKDAVNAAVELKKSTVYMVAQTYNSTAQPGLTDFRGDMVIDLNGGTLTNTGKYGFNSYFDNATEYAKFSITLKNGSIVNSNKNGFFLINTSTAQTQLLSIDLTFEDVKFSNTTSGAYILQAWGAINGTDTPGLNVTAKFNRCTINYDGKAVPIKTVFGNGDKEKIDLELNNCSIVSTKAGNIEKEDLFLYDNADKITLNSTTLTMPDKSYTSYEAIESDNNVTVFAYTSGNTVYTSKTAPKEAEAPDNYSAIPDIYPKELYPFAVYNGDSVTPYISWYQAISSDAAKGGTILLRRDYSTDECHNASQTPYSLGAMTLDLNGKVFTRGAQHIIQAYGKSTSETSTETTILIKNGIFLTKTNPIVIFNNSGNVGNNAIFDITFQGVSFSLANGYTASNMIVGNYTGGKYGSISTVTLDNCAIDLTKNASIGSIAPKSLITVFNLDGDSGKNFTEIIIKGGKIIADNLDKVTLYTLGASGTDKSETARSDSFTFAKAEGAYTELILKSGAVAPTAEYNGLVFVNVKDDGTNATYRLTPKEASDLNFIPKTSITLESDLSLNIYIPCGFDITSAVLEGETLDLERLEVKDGYYVYQKAMKSFEAGKKLALTVSLNWNGSALRGSFSFSIPKYAKNVLEGKPSEAEKTLVIDVLAYIRSAYTYFENAENKDDIIAEIDEVLDGYTPSAFGKTDTSYSIGEGLKAATFILTSTPTIRFYLTGSAEDYTFSEKITSSGKSVLDDGITYDYVDISLYAYKMIGVITYETKSGSNGSYHINSYVDYIKGDTCPESEKALTDLVEDFYTYCKSAKDYRDAVIDNAN